MTPIKEGKIYELRNFKSTSVQIIIFTHKDENGVYIEGTTNEEVIDMLVERLYVLSKGGYDASNQVAIDNLKNAKKALKKRARRKKNKYHGTDEEHKS